MDKPVFFLIKSMAERSSVSSMATSSFFSFLRKAIMLFLRAMGSGIRESISKSICCPLKFTNGMPRTYACMRRRLSFDRVPLFTRASPILSSPPLSVFFAAERSSSETSRESRINFSSCVSLTCIKKRRLLLF